MQIKNTKSSYGAVSKGLHWAIAILILGLVLVGLYMQVLPDSPDKFALYGRHKSFGLLVLWLAGFRIIWRFYNKPPIAENSHEYLEKFLAKIIHILLYAAMFAMPLTGWLMSSAGGYPVPFFGFQMPDIAPKNMELSSLANKAHVFAGYMLITAITLHVIGALKHHIIDEDLTLKRMAPVFLSGLQKPVLILILAVFGLGIVKFGIVDKLNNIEKPLIAKTAKELNQNLSSNQVSYNQHQWNIVEDLSQIEFEVDVYNKSFTAIFSKLDGVIIFNPDDLASSKVDIKINLKSVESGDAKRNSQMLGEGWFNVSNDSYSYFKSIEFQKSEEGRYIVIGNLTLAGKMMPVSIPFSLDIIESDVARRAYVEGQLQLNRLNFGLGAGQWKSDDIGHQVQVKIRLIAENMSNSVN